MRSGDAPHESPLGPGTPFPPAGARSGPAPRLSLEVIAGDAVGEWIEVDDTLFIGRHASDLGRLSEDEEISRQHARIAFEARGGYSIEDLGSSNGTFVNGLRIGAPQLLAVGDSIEVGATTLVVRSIVGAPTADEPEIDATGAAATVFGRVPPASEPVPAAPEPEPLEPQSGTDAPASGEPPVDPTGEAATVFGRVTPASEDAGPARSPAQSAELGHEPEPAGGTVAPRLHVALEVDFEGREATVRVGSDDSVIRLTLADGRWQARSAD